MISGNFDEHAALVALLRAHPDGLSWPEITAELLEAGSAVEVWARHAPAPALIELPDESRLILSLRTCGRGRPMVTGFSRSWMTTTRRVCAVFSKHPR
jgi:hypothetical protein